MPPRSAYGSAGEGGYSAGVAHPTHQPTTQPGQLPPQKHFDFTKEWPASWPPHHHKWNSAPHCPIALSTSSIQHNSNINLLSIDTADSNLVSSRPLTVTSSHYHSEDSTVSVESDSLYDVSDANMKSVMDSVRNKSDCVYSLSPGEIVRHSAVNFQLDISNSLSTFAGSNYRNSDINALQNDYHASDTKYTISQNECYPLIAYNSPIFPSDSLYHADYNMNITPLSDSQSMVSERNFYQSRMSCLKPGLKSNTFCQYHFGSQLVSGYTWLLTGNYDYTNNFGMMNHVQSNSYRMPHTRILTYNV